MFPGTRGINSIRVSKSPTSLAWLTTVINDTGYKQLRNDTQIKVLICDDSGTNM